MTVVIYDVENTLNLLVTIQRKKKLNIKMFKLNLVVKLFVHVKYCLLIQEIQEEEEEETIQNGSDSESEKENNANGSDEENEDPAETVSLIF